MFDVPPAIRTFPLLGHEQWSNVAVKLIRGAFMLPVAANVPVAGSYNSASARPLNCESGTLMLDPPPPAINTFPLSSRVAGYDQRAVSIEPVAVNDPPEYTSALASTVGWVEGVKETPPVTRTVPSFS